jgi:hypothetical protein
MRRSSPMKRSAALLFACITAALLVVLGASEAAQAKVSEAEAAKLGNELTPLGAIQGGSDDGTIPPWKGGITEPVAGYEPGMHHPDPFAADEVMFTITAENVAQYADKLSPGQVAMFERYPETWSIKVYPTRRSAAFPDYVYEATISNATRAELTESGYGVRNAGGGPPFPMPQNGLEGIWNHLLRYRGSTITHTCGQVAPSAGGAYTLVKLDEKVLVPYAEKGATTEEIGNISQYFLQQVTAPPRLAGYILLVHDTIDQVKEPRKAWTYNPGQRRVRRAPNIAYDNPGTASDGQRTSDQIDMYNGAPDRYDWELVGRREMYVPYNAYRLETGDLSLDDIVHAGHLNPEYLRYELHRVWVVEARVKEGTSHIYARRTFYLDEDSWSVLLVDQYDARGQIWRVSESHPINYYEHPLLWTTMETTYDLQNGRYLARGLYSVGSVPRFDLTYEPAEFSPDVLRRMGRR